MKKNTKIILGILAAVVVVAVLGITVFLKPGNEPVPPVTSPTEKPAVTETPTDTPEITEVPEITGVPTDIPSVTEEPAPTETPAVTETPEITDTPEVTETPTEVPEPTNIPIATPTETPTPTPTEIPETKPQYRVQMGDNVWYEFYDDGTLLVTGTGSTWDWTYNEYWDYLIETTGTEHGAFTADNILAKIKEVIVEEGVTRIGNKALSDLSNVEKVILPSTVTELGNEAFQYAGIVYEGQTEWVGLNLENMTVSGTAFYKADLPENADKNEVAAKPTPIPTPTVAPTPIPDPDNPRVAHAMKMGDNVTYEFMDNGYLYIKGSGKVWDRGELWKIYRDYENSNPVSKELFDSIRYVVVKDGVTYLGSYAGRANKEIWLPASLTSIHKSAGFTTEKLHWHHDGKAFTAVSATGGTFKPYKVYQILTDEEYAKEHEGEIIITWD